MAEQAETSSGFIALLGAPNAGKSTLVNTLVGSKISIVTHKIQTTRRVIRGIITKDTTQIVLVDTPGIFKATAGLEKTMVSAAWRGAREADCVLFVVDACVGLTPSNMFLLECLKMWKKPKILVLNKIDKIKREQLLHLTTSIEKQVNFERCFMISALTGSGCTDLLNYLYSLAHKGPWYYPEGEISDLPLRKMAEEITREKLFFRLHEELPYGMTVETQSWEEGADGSVKIHQIIYIERASHKKIVVGKAGATLKAIGQAARQKLSQFLGCKVHLFLFVKLQENWRKDPNFCKQTGIGSV